MSIITNNWQQNDDDSIEATKMFFVFSEELGNCAHIFHLIRVVLVRRCVFFFLVHVSIYYNIKYYI